MGSEIEIKLRLDDPTALRERLRRRGATLLSHVSESNTLLDTAERNLFSQGCGLRIRTTRALSSDASTAALLTFKGPQAPGRVKIREELETRIESGEALEAILAALGFCPLLRFEKRRETWRCETSLLTIDELPRLGWFAEIEGPSAPAVEALADELLGGRGALEPATYAELIVRAVPADSDGTRTLRFS